jgi:hypothetical protein
VTSDLAHRAEPLYALDPRIIFVRRVKSSLRSSPLCKRRFRDLDAEDPGWEERTGDVTQYLLDYQTGFLRTYRTPTAADLVTLGLTVVRAPLKAMAGDSATPEIAPRWHMSLRHWMVFLAYMKPDEDTYRPDKAKVALALFEQEFGKRSSAQDEKWINDNHGYDNDEGLY